MHAEAHRSVVQVSDGRGFVVQGDERYIVTASHCLPHLPAPLSLDQRAYSALVGPLGAECSVWAECLFVDPIGDIAVLASPEYSLIQELPQEAKAYHELVNQTPPLALRPCQKLAARSERREHLDGEEEGWLLALDANHWFRCTVQRIRQSLWIADAAEPIAAARCGAVNECRSAERLSLSCESPDLTLPIAPSDELPTVRCASRERFSEAELQLGPMRSAVPHGLLKSQQRASYDGMPPDFRDRRLGAYLMTGIYK